MRVLLLAVLLVWLSPAGARCVVPEQVRPVSVAADGELALATQNLWRLAEAELTDAEQDARLKAWSRHLRDVLRYPHVIAVQEVDTLAMLESLAARIAADGGPAYRAVLAEGNDPSGIDVAVLYRDPVRVASVQPLFAREQLGRDWLFSRPPLQLEISEPFPFDMLALHLRSGRGLLDNPRVAVKRRAQATRIRDWALARLAEGRPVLLAGDLNSDVDGELFGEPLRILEQPPFWSAWQAVPASERFSYFYRCQPQAIDHLLLSPALRQRHIRTEVSRGNAGRYRVLHGGKGAGAVVSDHDALVVYVRQK